MNQKREMIDTNLKYKRQFLHGLEDAKFKREYGYSDLIKDPTTTMGLLYKQGWLFAKDVSSDAQDSLIDNMKRLIGKEESNS